MQLICPRLTSDPARSKPRYGEAIASLLRETARSLIVASGLFWLVSTLLTTINWSGERLPGLLVCLLAVARCSCLPTG